ncbi:MAG: hypothetical protein AABY92_03085 [Thermodesulfobacteriota bacterium]
MITIRQEQPEDVDGIRCEFYVPEEAFGRPGKANLLDALRRRGRTDHRPYPYPPFPCI